MPVAIAILACLLHGPAAMAQTNTAEISGVVTDSSGGVLPGATVTARHVASGIVVERVTDAQGRCLLPALRIGEWQIIATLPGFASQIRTGIVFEVGRALNLEIALGVEGLTEQITVERPVPLLQTATAEISDVIENREVVQLPINGRNFLGLAQLSDTVIIPPVEPAARRSSRQGRCRMSEDSDPVTTSTCSTARRSPTNCSTISSSIRRLTPSRSSGSRSRCIPLAAVRGGNFAGLGAICDPLTIPTAGVCVPFANSQIPADHIDPTATAFLAHVPQPTSDAAVQNLASVERSTRALDQASVRVDRRIGVNDQLLARFSTFDAEDLQPFGTSALQEALVPGFGRSLTTSTRNLVASHTHVIGQRMLNELRFGWMRVSGGQVSVNRGHTFACDVGLLGVTSDVRDAGFPQISTGGLYSTMGDPTTFTTRNNQHFELYDNVTLDRGAHRIKFGAYYFHLQLRPEQPDNARGTFTYSGQFTGNAFADFLLGYPTSATSGIGRGDENGRTNWLHLYAQDDWQVRRNLTSNLGLRYEFNQHMYDVDNRLSSIDLSVPGGRFVIASDETGNVNPDAQALLPLIPIPYVMSRDAGWARGLLDPSAVRLAPRVGFALALDDSRAVIRGGYGIFLNQWAYSVQTAFARNLPFFFTKQVDVPIQQRVPTLRTRDILTSNATGTVGASTMDFAYNVEYSQTWRSGIQYELFPATMVEASYMGTWTLGADNATVHNVPEPGAGAIQPRRPIPQLSRINAIRFDGKSIYHGVTFKVERRLANNFAYNVSYTLSQSKDDASSPGATESETNVPQNVRNIFGEGGEWALSSFDHRHQFIASGVYQLPFFSGAGGLAEAVLGGWRANAIFTAQSGAPFTVNLSVDQANIGAGPAQRPDQLHDPNLPGGRRTPDRWFDTSAFALPAPFTFGSAARNSVIGPGFANLDVAVAKTWAIGGRSALELRWEIFNVLNRANFELPNRIFGSPNFGRIFSATSAREMQRGARLVF